MAISCKEAFIGNNHAHHGVSESQKPNMTEVARHHYRGLDLYAKK